MSDHLPRERLAAAVRDRRAQLGLTQEAMPAHGGPSGRTVWKIEHAQLSSFTPAMHAKLDRALDWPAGTAVKILEGTATEDDLNPVAPHECSCEQRFRQLCNDLAPLLDALAGALRKVFTK